MNKFKIGDRVRAVKDCSNGWFKKGQTGKVAGNHMCYVFIVFDNDDKGFLANPDEIELIESTPKQFPTFEEFDEWFYLRWDSEMKTLYNYFAQFGVRTVEVPLELGNMYEFSSDKENWEIRLFHGYSTIMGGETKYYPCIRPIQPSRLEQLKEKHPNLTNDEKTELLDILLTQRKEQ
jgi:hypothetical protein